MKCSSVLMTSLWGRSSCEVTRSNVRDHAGRVELRGASSRFPVDICSYRNETLTGARFTLRMCTQAPAWSIELPCMILL